MHAPHLLESVAAWAADRIILAPIALKDIATQIDAEIARLKRARSLVAASHSSVALLTVDRGRPKKNAVTPALSKPGRKKRNLSSEGRARIAEAVNRRWAKQKAKGKKNGKTYLPPIIPQ